MPCHAIDHSSVVRRQQTGQPTVVHYTEASEGTCCDRVGEGTYCYGKREGTYCYGKGEGYMFVAEQVQQLFQHVHLPGQGSLRHLNLVHNAVAIHS